MTRGTVVISAVNLFEGGPLSVLQDCLAAAAGLADRYDVVALVHDASLAGVEKVRTLEFPRSRSSWLHRLYYEFVAFRKLSRRLRPVLWLSLHDITPDVEAERRAVYCHNPAPFFRMRVRDVALDPRFALFCWFYSFLYRINIRKNSCVVVQQAWLADEFRRRFGVERLVVAHPSVPPIPPASGPLQEDGTKIFVFPTFPRFFKNIEVLGEAARILAGRGREDVEVWVTLDGTENRYARSVRRRYGDVPNLRLVGRKTRSEVFEIYRRSTGLVFPSKLETWGVPLSEYRQLGRPILAADLPYARETVGDYARVKFFQADDAAALADAMTGVAAGTLAYDATLPVGDGDSVEGWGALLELLLAVPPGPAGRRQAG